MIEPLPQLNTKRFQVALSFAGEHRSFVEGVAEQLSRNLGQNRVFYDRYYEAELARPNLDIYLTKIYQEDTDLIAIFLCSNYAQKEWCGLEWRVVRDVLKRRRDSEIMSFKFDDIVIEGLLSIDGYIDIGNRTPEEVAYLILQRIDGKGTLPLHSSKSKLSVMPNLFYGDSLQLLGRDEEIRRIKEKLQAGNHCSIVGPPGSGKSHLLRAIWSSIPSWLGCQPQQVQLLPFRGVTSLRDLQEMLVKRLGGQRANELRSLLYHKPLRLLALDDLGSMDPGSRGLQMRSWLRSLDDGLDNEYRTKLLMVSNERLDILFRRDDPNRDSPLAGLDPLPVELAPLSPEVCYQIVQQRLAVTSLRVEQFTDLFDTTSHYPQQLLALCAARYEALR
jgi:TIR domain